MKVKPHPDFIWPLGRLSRIVFSHRGNTHVARTAYKEPSRSPQQLLGQTAFTVADLAWQNLPDPGKDLWREWRKWDRLHGYPWFMRINIPLARSGQPLLLSPPPYPPR